MSPLLSLSGVESYYGASQALFGMQLEIERGAFVTLLGRNGMGKSTTVKSMTGLMRPARGEIVFDGQPVHTSPSHRIARAGMGLVPEGRQIFPTLTVRENLVATASNRHGASSPWTLERIYGLFPRLREREKNLGSNLSGGEQQMLAIGRALMTNPKLLILDEATEGLAPLIRGEIWQCLKQLKGSGLSILCIDKNLAPMLELGDRHYIVDKGRVAWQGDSPSLRQALPELQTYLGV
ncbi:ABC transporter ATP-binding protein [Pandoraea fibrosis]|uniref:ABC transporter ATP-binding protein n=1 Tax=Pandoraea fibrosis TaxID=1891094 RepID=A0A5E4YKQ6_9BURK|nr:ABC transporter ATP-binding protein [Pandoraea fibrosis]QHE93354.1 ATP-binding cassette domain-containing protein [Pandoraea fibrosis]QHF13086.1 ATP-binding cassette domain-containing protein [Pandoraea fibrosis]VVE49000.1 ABC transporter ATP-binding protein [Pandoraea fibrosis]